MSGKGVSIIKVDKKKDKLVVKRPSLFSRFFNRFRGRTVKSGPGRKGEKEPKMTRAKRLDEARIQKKEWSPVTGKTRWECQRCGWCCRQNCRVNVTWEEFDRLKGVLNIDQVVLDEASRMSHPLFEIKDACVCLDTKKNLCKIHSKWPYACATFPFGLNPEGRLIYSRWCKGIGSGPVVNRKKMVKKIIKERKRAGMQVNAEAKEP